MNDMKTMQQVEIPQVEMTQGLQGMQAALQQMLVQAPPPRTSHYQAVAACVDEIRVLREKGFTFKQISGHLKQHGVQIAAATLSRHYKIITGEQTAQRKAKAVRTSRDSSARQGSR